jgi:hypothetical protein
LRTKGNWFGLVEINVAAVQKRDSQFKKKPKDYNSEKPQRILTCIWTRSGSG